MTPSELFLEKIDAHQKLLIASISDIRESVEAIAVAESLRPRLGAYLNWEFNNEERRLIQSFLDVTVEFSSVSAPSNVLTLYGLFENYVRRLVSVFVETISTVLSRADLPDGLVDENVLREASYFQPSSSHSIICR